jgi:hypothetical protein
MILKKLSVFMITACLLFAGVLVMMPASALAVEPTIQTLYAGQFNAVGTVEVTNDGDNIYVKYQLYQDKIDDGWRITETHVHVGIAIADFPLAGKLKDNPVPGKFAYPGYFNPGVSEYEEVIPLGDWEADQEVIIAAHAVVVRIDAKSDCLTVLSGDRVSQTTDALWSEDEETWYPAFLTFEHPAWADVGDAAWIWRTATTDPQEEYANVPEGGWYFKHAFDLPLTAFNIVGTISANADNAETVAVNGVPLLADGTMNRDGPDNNDYKDVETANLAGSVMPGSNEINIRSMNYFDYDNNPTGGPSSLYGDGLTNPAGLAYSLTVCYDYTEVVCSETAWADGTRFTQQGNWGTWFKYTIVEKTWNLVDTVTVDSANKLGANSVTLESGVQYKIVVDGSYWTNRGWESVDASYVSADGWVTHTDGPGPPGGPYDQRLLELQVNEQFVNWGPYSGEHIYTLMFDGEGSTVNFRVFDGDPTTNTLEPGWYGDNVGSLTVKIYV